MPHGTAPVVAVIDTGADAAHPDLVGALVAGADIVNGGTVTKDPDGHGTHVAGIIGARVDNGTGVAGLVPDARVMPVNVFGPDGLAWSSDIATGIVWAVDHGAKVLNLSLGSDSSAPVEEAAVRWALEQGAVVVAAMGNDGESGSPTSYPAAYPGVLAVGATAPDDSRASFSSTGAHIGVAAPGDDVLSTYPGNRYAYLSGTSMATPYAAAAAALVLGAWPALRPGQVVAHLRSTAEDLGAPGHDPEYGYGLIDPVRALSTQPAGVTAAPLPTGTAAAAPEPAATGSPSTEPAPAPATTPDPAPQPSTAPAPVPTAAPAPAPVPAPQPSLPAVSPTTPAVTSPAPSPTATQPGRTSGLVLSVTARPAGTRAAYGSAVTVSGTALADGLGATGTARLLQGGRTLATAPVRAGRLTLRAQLVRTGALRVSVTAGGRTEEAALGPRTAVATVAWAAASSGRARARTAFPADIDAPAGLEARLEQQVGRRWTVRAVAPVPATGGTTFRWTPPRGTSTLRVVVPAGAETAAGVSSAQRHTAR
nr:S8 family serine peptidase [Motilibacter aurantiacus]